MTEVSNSEVEGMQAGKVVYAAAPVFLHPDFPPACMQLKSSFNGPA